MLSQPLSHPSITVSPVASWQSSLPTFWVDWLGVLLLAWGLPPQDAPSESHSKLPRPSSLHKQSQAVLTT